MSATTSFIDGGTEAHMSTVPAPRYAAFISYRHTDYDLEHARSLETALRRYAKPLWRPPIAIFRDARVLKPGDDLPRGIRKALVGSEYLLYLATKNAAESPWVQEELRIWCEEMHRTDRLIIVHVSDSIEVDATSKAVNWERTDALPALLKPFISTAPVWVDLSWASKDAQRDLLNADYRAAINAITARLRGLEPGAMSDGEVITHRRNMRLRNVFIAVIFFSMLAAIFFGARANSEAKNAQSAKNDALNQAHAALEAASAAAKAQESEKESRKRAEAERDLSQANELGARAEAAFIQQDYELALRLAMGSLHTSARSTVGARVAVKALDALRAQVVIRHRADLEPKQSSSWLCPECDLVATSGDDGYIRIWDSRTMAAPLELAIPKEEAPILAKFSEDGRVLLVAMASRRVYSWDLSRRSRQPNYSRVGPLASPVKGLGRGFPDLTTIPNPFSPWQLDETLPMELKAPTPARTERRHRTRTFLRSPINIVSIELDDHGRFALITFRNGGALVWDLDTGRVIAPPKSMEKLVSIGLARDTSEVVGLSYSKLLRWRIASPEDATPMEEELKPEHRPSGALLALGKSGQTHWMGPSFSLVLKGSSSQEYRLMSGHQQPIVSISGLDAEDRKVTVDTGGTARVWDLESGKSTLLNGPARFAAFSRDKRRIATVADDPAIRVWDANSGQQLATLKGHTDLVTEVQFSRDGRRMISRSLDGTVRVWATESDSLGSEISLGAGTLISGPMVSADGLLLAVRSTKGIHVLSSAARRELFFVHLPKIVQSVRYRPTTEPRPVAFGFVGSNLFILDEESLRLWSGYEGKVLRECKLSGRIDPLRSVITSQNAVLWLTDSNELYPKLALRDRPNALEKWHWASACAGSSLNLPSEPMTLSLHATRFGAKAAFLATQGEVAWRSAMDWTVERKVATDSSVHSIVLSPDAEQMAAFGESAEFTLHSIATKRQTKKLRLREARIAHIAFSASGNKVLAVDHAGYGKIWNARSGQILAEFQGDGTIARAVAFSPNEAIVVTSGDDAAVKVWSASTGALLGELTGHLGGIRGVGFTARGRNIVTAGADGTIRFWEAPSRVGEDSLNKLVEEVERRLRLLGKSDWSGDECDLYFPATSPRMPDVCTRHRMAGGVR